MSPRALAAACLALAACTGAPPAPAGIQEELARAEAELEAGAVRSADRRLNRVLAETQAERESFALERFRAAERLARLHTQLALEEPGGALAPRAIPAGSGPRPGAGLVAVVYHASQALSERARAERAGPESSAGGSSVPESCAALELLLSWAHTRLGFRAEASALLAARPELHAARRALPRFAELSLPSACLPWVCDALFEVLRSQDELEAYRFAVLALEGQARFGSGLPPAERERLESWIENGASVLFVCPRSHTPWLRGLTRSPISGIPHLDYVGVERSR